MAILLASYWGLQGSNLHLCWGQEVLGQLVQTWTGLGRTFYSIRWMPQFDFLVLSCIAKRTSPMQYGLCKSHLNQLYPQENISVIQGVSAGSSGCKSGPESWMDILKRGIPVKLIQFQVCWTSAAVLPLSARQSYHERKDLSATQWQLCWLRCPLQVQHLNKRRNCTTSITLDVNSKL